LSSFWFFGTARRLGDAQLKYLGEKGLAVVAAYLDELRDRHRIRPTFLRKLDAWRG
jgi:hypothetical protein